MEYYSYKGLTSPHGVYKFVQSFKVFRRCALHKFNVMHSNLEIFHRSMHGNKVSYDMRFPKMWYVRPAKAQASLSICTV